MASSAFFRSILNLSDLEYIPSEQHIEHYIYYHPSLTTSTPRSKIQPYLSQGFSKEMEGSSFLHKLAWAQIPLFSGAGHSGKTKDAKIHGSDWIFKFTAARLAVLRLYEYFIAEKINAIVKEEKTTGKPNPERAMLQKLKNNILLENDLTTLLCARHACQQYGKTIINGVGLKMYQLEKGFLAPAFSVLFVDDSILQVNDLSVSRIIRYNIYSPYDDTKDVNTTNLFAEWLNSNPKQPHLELKVDFPSSALSCAMSTTLPLATYYNNNAHNLDCSVFMMYWLTQLNHPYLALMEQQAAKEILEDCIVQTGKAVNELKENPSTYIEKYLKLMQPPKDTLEELQTRIQEFKELANQINLMRKHRIASKKM